MFICPLDTIINNLNTNFMALVTVQKKSDVNGVLDSPVINPTGNMFGPSAGSAIEIDPSFKDSFNQSRSYDTLIDEIRSSEVYKTVYDVFKNGRQSTYWLSMLQGVLDSIPRIESHFGEALTHNFEEQYNALYQEAIQNIRTLYSEYQTWINSLAVTQVQQLSEVGYNSAITGQGLTGSSLSPTQSTLSESGSMPTTNTAEVVGNIANFALSASGGLTSTLSAIADTVLKFRGQALSEEQLAYNKDMSFQTFKKEMASNGVLIKSTSWSELNDKDPNWNMSAGAKAKNLYNEWSYVDNFYKYSPELSAFNVEQGLTDNMRSIGRLQLGLRLAEMTHKIDRRNIQMPTELEEDKLVEYRQGQQRVDAIYNITRAELFTARLLELSEGVKNGNPVAEVELINFMQNADWQESLVYLLGEDVDFGDLGSEVSGGITNVVDGLNTVVDILSPSVDNTGDNVPSPLNPIGYGAHLLKKLGTKLRDKFKKTN